MPNRINLKKMDLWSKKKHPFPNYISIFLSSIKRRDTAPTISSGFSNCIEIDLSTLCLRSKCLLDFLIFQ